MPAAHLRAIIDAGLAAVETRAAVRKALPEKPKGKCIVIGAGKGSALMAAALEEAWPDVNISGVIATRYGHGHITRRVKVIEAGHPYPDNNSVKAANAILKCTSDLTPDDTVIALMSGGGSACLAAPVNSMTLEDKNRITRDLLACGANIGEINTVRKCISKIKGGQLAAHIHPARLINLVISDIPGDALCDVASGPTIVQTRSSEKAQNILRRYGIAFNEAWFEACAIETAPDIKAEDILVASPMQALTAMTLKAGKFGYIALNLGDLIETDSRDFANEIADKIKQVRGDYPGKSVAIISGGETSVTLRNDTPGRGGRNSEFVLALLLAMKHDRKYAAIAIDSDGYDGASDGAGAMLTPDILDRIKNAGLSPQIYLDRHDSFSFFENVQADIKIGPTYTNVNDLRAILVLP